MARLTYTATEAAEVLGISKWLVYRLAASGELPCRQAGRRKLFSKAAIDAWLECPR